MKPQLVEVEKEMTAAELLASFTQEPKLYYVVVDGKVVQGNLSETVLKAGSKAEIFPAVKGG